MFWQNKEIIPFDCSAYLNMQFLKNQLYLYISIFSLIVTSSCTSQNQIADTILYNGKIITMDEGFSVMEAVAIKEGKILEVGNNKDILSLASDATHSINLQGHSVIPGIIEGHTHLIAASPSEYFDSIPHIDNVKDILELISKEAQIKGDEEWIIHPKFFLPSFRKCGS